MIENSDEYIEATEYFREYVEQLSWKFAKTMPKHPHFYAVRWDRPDLDGMFCKFAQFIRDYGYTEYFFGKPMRYFNIGEWKYWTMGAPIRPRSFRPANQNTFILNRAKIQNRYGEQR